jgi:cytoskeletal protein CcmA (bactofilin family)
MYTNFDTGFGIINSNDVNYIKNSTIGDGFFVVKDGKRLFLQSGDTFSGLCIDSNNNIGIGKANPLQKLDISGSVVASSYKLQNSLLTVIDTSGNIYSNERLDISKNLNINNNKFIINSLNGNTFVGDSLNIAENIQVNDKILIESTTGNIISNGNLDISGNLNLSNKFGITSEGNTTISNTLDVSNNVTIRKNATVLGSLTTSNPTLYVDSSNNQVGINTTFIEPNINLYINGNTRIEGPLLVNGATAIKNNLQTSSNQLFVTNSDTGPALQLVLVNGTTSVQNNLSTTTNQLSITNSGTGPALQVNQNGSQSIVEFKDDDNTVFLIKNGGNIGVGRNNSNPLYNWDVSGNMNVSELILNEGINLSGESLFNGNLSCGGKIFLTDGLNLTNNKFTIDSSGNIDISGNIVIWGDLTTYGNYNQSGLFDLPGDLIVNGNTYVKKNVDVSRNLRVNTDMFTVNNLGNITTKGNLDISNNFTLNNNAFIVDSLTGNIKSKGNLDISKNLFIGNNIVTFDTFGNIKCSNNLNVKNNFNINNNFIINSESGNVTSTGNLDLSKNITVNTNKFIVDLNGNLKIMGNFDISNNFSINSNKFIADSSGNISSNGNLDLSNNFNINLDKFIVDFNGNVKTQGTLDISNNFTINNDYFILDNNGNISTKGNLDISRNLNINNNKFSIDLNGNISSMGNFDISNNFTSGDVLYIDSINKRVGINRIPMYTLDVSESIATNNTYFGSLNNTDDIIFSHRANANNTDYALKQTKNGKSVINSKSIGGSIEFSFNNNVKHKLDPSGNITIDGDLYIYSDQNIKKNIEYIDHTLDKLKYMRGVTYNFIKDPSKKRQIGVIAQEIEKVLPEVVKNDGEYKTVAYSNMVGFLVEVIKELDNKIENKMIFKC